jgi:hypothetical protein
VPAHGAPAAAIPVTTYLVILALVVGRFLFRELRERKIVLARIFLVPAIVGCLAIFLLVTTAMQFPTTDILLAGETCLTLGIGLGVGLAVGHFTKVRLGEKPGIVYVLGSWQTIAIWLGALLLRLLARFFISFDDRTAQLAANSALVVMVAAALAMLRYRVLVDARVLREKGITASVPVV